jgi:hypothetical protein
MITTMNMTTVMLSTVWASELPSLAKEGSLSNPNGLRNSDSSELTDLFNI